jgi:hypothetical protein
MIHPASYNETNKIEFTAMVCMDLDMQQMGEAKFWLPIHGRLIYV